MNVIELINLTKEFKNVTAVKNLNLKITKGTFFGFLGPNGAGKTTTIKMIVGLLKPTYGKIKLFGFDINKEEIEYKRRIGIVLDEPLFFDKLTAKEYLQFVGQMYSLDKKVIEVRSEELLEFFELQEKRNEFIETYSSGMKKKISLAAALIHDPDLLILDEPFEGIDVLSSNIIKKNLEQLVKKGGTIFMTSHILEIVEKLCNEIAIIDKGNLIFKCSKDKIKEEIKKRKYFDLESLFLKLIASEREKEKLSWLE